MSNIQNNIINKKKKKKKNEMSLEDYSKIHKIEAKVSFKYEGDIEELQEDYKKSNYMQYKSNIINNKKNESPKKINDVRKNNYNKKEAEIEEYLNNSYKSLGLHKLASASTNNSSLDEDKINNNLKNIKNSYKEDKISKPVNPIITNSYYRNTNNLNNRYNSNYLNYNYPNYVNTPYKSFNDNININVNFNLYNNYNFNNMNLYYNKFNNLNYFLSANYKFYSDKLKIIRKNINEILNEIKDLENKSLIEMILSYQCTDLIKYINKKNKILINNNISNDNKLEEDNEKKSPEHPYFYTNHNEEIQIKNILYLIEGLFSEDNLKKDFNLLPMLNRDGYASLSQLEKHPQIEKCKVLEKHLKIVFSEHRVNEVTETVETFDDILIRNKNWRKIKKEIGDIEKIKENSLNSMKNIKEFQMKNLLEKKRNYLNIQGDILFKYQINNNNIQKEFNYNYNNVYNINNLFNNNIFTNYYNNSYSY